MFRQHSLLRIMQKQGRCGITGDNHLNWIFLFFRRYRISIISLVFDLLNWIQLVFNEVSSVKETVMVIILVSMIMLRSDCTLVTIYYIT